MLKLYRVQVVSFGVSTWLSLGFEKEGCTLFIVEVLMFRVRVGDGKNLLDGCSLYNKGKDLVACITGRPDGWGMLVVSTWSEFVPL